MHRHELQQFGTHTTLHARYDGIESLLQGSMERAKTVINDRPESARSSSFHKSRLVTKTGKVARKSEEFYTGGIALCDATDDLLNGSLSAGDAREIFEDKLESTLVGIVGHSGRKAKAFTGKRRAKLMAGGGSLAVAKYAAGSDVHWRRKQKKSVHPVVRVCVNMSANCGVRTERWAELWGQATAYAQALTDAGYAVQMTACFITTGAPFRGQFKGEQPTYVSEEIIVKKPDRPLDVESLLSLSHVALFRTWMFQEWCDFDEGRVLSDGTPSINAAMHPHSGLGCSATSVTAAKQCFGDRFDIYLSCDSSRNDHNMIVDQLKQRLKSA